MLNFPGFSHPWDTDVAEDVDLYGISKGSFEKQSTTKRWSSMCLMFVRVQRVKRGLQQIARRFLWCDSLNDRFLLFYKIN
jgi:hypothetical protein